MDDEYFPELQKATIVDRVVKTAKVYSCVSKVLLYPLAIPDPTKRYVLIYVKGV